MARAIFIALVVLKRNNTPSLRASLLWGLNIARLGIACQCCAYVLTLPECYALCTYTWSGDERYAASC